MPDELQLERISRWPGIDVVLSFDRGHVRARKLLQGSPRVGLLNILPSTEQTIDVALSVIGLEAERL